jgi:hypothetical protein
VPNYPKEGIHWEPQSVPRRSHNQQEAELSSNPQREKQLTLRKKWVHLSVSDPITLKAPRYHFSTMCGKSCCLAHKEALSSILPADLKCWGNTCPPPQAGPAPHYPMGIVSQALAAQHWEPAASRKWTQSSGLSNFAGVRRPVSPWCTKTHHSPGCPLPHLRAGAPAAPLKEGKW